MRICYITIANNLHAQRWIKYFADKGHEIHIISLFYESENDYELDTYDFSIKNIKIYHIKRHRLLRFFIPPAAFYYDATKVKKLLKMIEPDLIHAHYVADQGIVAAFSGYHPLVLSAWGSDILVAPRNSRVFRSLIKYALKKSDVITCDGENVREGIKNLGVDEQKIELIYHGVDPKIFNSSARSTKLRDELELDNQLAVISTRHFFPVYDVETLVKSIPLVLKEFQNVKFILASDGPNKQKLENLAKSLGISDRIVFPGYLPWDQLPTYLASSDIYVSCSVSEGGIAVSTMEAMASNLPLILTNVGDNDKWIENGINGFIIPLNDSRTLADKILYLLKHEEMRKKFGQLNRDLICKKGDYLKQMKRMETIYMEIIRRHEK